MDFERDAYNDSSSEAANRNKIKIELFIQI